MSTVPSVSPRRVLPLWAHFSVSALAILLPLWCLLGLGAWIYVDKTRADYEQQTLVLARKVGSGLENQLSGLGGMLQALATSPALQDGDFRRFHHQASQVVPQGAAIVLRDRTGQQLVNTLFPFGTPLPVTTASAVLAADECVFRTQSLCASDLYVGTTDRQPYILIDAPVVRDGRIDFALNIAIRARHLSTLLNGTLVSESWTASIVDRQDKVIARSREHERFVGRTVSEPLRVNAQGQEGSFRGVSLEGTPVWAAYVRLPEWGWLAAVGVPEEVIQAPLRQSALYLGVGGLLAVSLSVVWLARSGC